VYVWDAENRLNEVRRASDNALIASYRYDSMSRRIRKTTTEFAPQGADDRVFIYDGWNLLCEYEVSNGQLALDRAYTWGPDLSGSLQGAGGVGGLLAVDEKDGSSVHSPLYDGNGNVLGLVQGTASTAASVSATYDYDAFGNTTFENESGAVENPFRFSTKYFDKETGFYYYGYRFYDPVTGRWPSRDPIGERGGMNLYGFVENKPSQAVDRLGLAVTSIDGNITPTDDDGANCSVTIYFGRGNTSGDLRNRSGTIDEQPDKELERGDGCRRSAFVGCGANRANTIADVSGVGVPEVPLNDEPFPPGQPRPGIDTDSDCLHEGSELGRISGALEAALLQAASMATSRPPCCCKCVRVKVVCLGGILDEIIKELGVVEGGDKEEINRFKATCNFTTLIYSP
jgi:RHS repeat-associated protein